MQLTGSFKVRPVGNGVLARRPDSLRHRIDTVSSGNTVIVEGPGAISATAAQRGRHPYRPVCAVVSGGNLDVSTLFTIIGADVPDQPSSGGRADAIRSRARRTK